jgi:hypothetical protein
MNFVKLMFLVAAALLPVSIYALESCESDEDCGPAMNCNVDNNCVRSIGSIKDDIVHTITVGENSPENYGFNIVVPAPSYDLVLAQLNIKSVVEDGEGTYFFFKGVDFKVSRMPKVEVENIRLIHDVNGDGHFNGEDRVLTEGEFLEVEDESGNKKRLFRYTIADPKLYTFEMKPDTYILAVADMFYGESVNSETTDDSVDPEVNDEDFSPESDAVEVPYNTIFNLSYEALEESIDLPSTSATLGGSSILFSTFMFEPTTGYFLMSKSEVQPEVPQDWKAMNGNIDVLNIRAKSLDGANTITELSFSLGNTTIKFGEGAEFISIYSNDTLISKQETFSENSGSFTFTGLSIPFEEGEVKELTVKCDFDFKDNQSAVVKLDGAKFETSMNVERLPLESALFEYDCDNSDPECKVVQTTTEQPDTDVSTGVEEKSSGGCSVLTVF